MKKRVGLLLAITLLFSVMSFSQEECKVLRKDISGTYKGDCKKDLADGKGLATGENTYVGSFKKGLPHGNGTLTYADGGKYEGSFKKGLRSGVGKYVIIKEGAITVTEGIWKKGKFSKKVKKKTYKITKRFGVSNYRIQKVGDTQNRVTIKITRNGSAYQSPNNIQTSGGIQSYGVNSIVYESIDQYPFTCQMIYDVPSALGNSTTQVEFNFEILEPGDWLITLRH